MFVPRAALARGCERGTRSSCTRKSGEAFNRNQARPSALTATDDWVRGVTRVEPARASRQFEQLQFHWGSPPPAAVPKRMIRMTPKFSRFHTVKTQELCLRPEANKAWFFHGKRTFSLPRRANHPPSTIESGNSW